MTPRVPESLRWRCIGPARGGRVVAVAGDPTDRLRFYFGSTGGGVWGTSDGGRAWMNLSDGQFGSASVGALAVSDADPKVLYAGMGECCIRQNTTIGDGVYRSDDRGRTWRHLGLTGTRQIARVRVNPLDPNLVYVAALGHAFGPNPERGVFRSPDGGSTWDLILKRDADTGAIDLAIDPSEPRRLYVALWQARRTFWEFASGGPGSGLFRTDDGGNSWSEISRAAGLPRGLLGRIGLTVSPAQEGRIWTVVEAEHGAGGLFRSDDGGESRQRVNEGRGIFHRPWYCSHVFADPRHADTVYLADENFWRSRDGGATFTQVATPHGDNHDLWIDPADPDRMIEGNDGGACVSFDAGSSWSSLYNQPTAEIYHVTTDTRFPYRVYGAQQDSSTISLPSRSEQAVITQRDYYDVGGRECGMIAVRPDDPDIVYAGGQRGIITRFDRRTDQRRNVMVWPEDFDGWGSKDLRHRFSWTFPIVLSPHDPRVLYAAGERVFRTTDEGDSWTAISPDLTRRDPAKMERSGGPITKDNTGAEVYAVVFAFAESPRRPGLFWAGTDDGLLHVSDDAGDTWRNVTPSGLYPEWSLVSTIEPSPHDERVAYVAVTAHKLDDYRPYVLRTEDTGPTWTCIANGLPEASFARVVREDPERRGLLYLGSESGVYVSADAGSSWSPLKLNLPVVPVHDLVVKERDLVIATHGRSFWILDDCTPLQQLDERARSGTPFLYAPRDTYRVMKPNLAGIQGLGQITNVVGAETPTQFQGTPGYIEFTSVQRRDERGRVTTQYLDAGENRAEGVHVHYELSEVHGKVVLTIRRADGSVVRAFTDAAPSAGEEVALQSMPGSNRFVWDMRHRETIKAEGPAYAHSSISGPLVPPGHFVAELFVDGRLLSRAFTLLLDPRATATQNDLEEQERFLLRVHAAASQLIARVNEVRRMRGRLASLLASGAAPSLVRRSRPLDAALTGIESSLIEPNASHWKEVRHWTAKPLDKLAYLSNVVGAADARPTRQSLQVFDTISDSIRVVYERADALKDETAAFLHETPEAGLRLHPESVT